MILYDDNSKRIYEICSTLYQSFKFFNASLETINDKSYLVLTKDGKSDFKMEYFIHKWEASGEYFNFKDEIIFCVPLNELLEKQIINIDEYQIALIDEQYQLYYYGVYDRYIVYAKEDLRKYSEEDNPPEYKISDALFFYDTLNKESMSMDISGCSKIILVKNKVFEKVVKEDYFWFVNIITLEVYKTPYKRTHESDLLIECVTENVVLLSYILRNEMATPEYGIILYDLEKSREINRLRSERIYPFRHQYYENSKTLILY